MNEKSSWKENNATSYAAVDLMAHEAKFFGSFINEASIREAWPDIYKAG
jgi:hypothetical protein